MYNFNIDKMMWTFVTLMIRTIAKTQRTKISDMLIHCAPHHFRAATTIVNTSLKI